MVVCIQNHDQIGNRPYGRRLNHQIDPALFRALSALLLFLPETPLIFMGQEWAAGTPFQFFTDHHDDLGRLVTEGRRQEFSRFEAFADPVARASIPDPQSWSTFERSRLDWAECARPPHAGVLELYRALLRLRRTERASGSPDRLDAVAPDDAALVVMRGRGDGRTLLLAMCVRPSGRVDLGRWRSTAQMGRWEVVLTTEDSPFEQSQEAPGAFRPAIELEADLAVTFRRPSAVILKAL